MFRKKKVEVVEEKEKYNCEEQGHRYIIVKYIRLVNIGKDLEKPTGIELLIECRECGKRKELHSDMGTTNSISKMWSDGEIDLKTMNYFIKKLGKKWEEYQKKFEKIKEVKDE
jgi:hypothetical protein